MRESSRAIRQATEAPRCTNASSKVFLILDNLPVHCARLVRDWLAERKAEIEVFHLLAYSPELNPDEA